MKRMNYIGKISLALSLIAGGLYGQSTFGEFTGSVTDPSGGVVQGASVEAKSQTTNRVRTVTTASNGVYRIPDLDPDSYTITVSASGFTDSAYRNIQLPARETIRVDAQLAVAGATPTTVDVRETVVTEDLTRSDSKSGSQITSLALNFRATGNPSPLVVANLAPNVQPDST